MYANELLNRLLTLNVKLWVEGDQIRYRAPKDIITPDLLNEIRQNKSDILNILKERSEDVASDQKNIKQIDPPSCNDQIMWNVYSSMYYLPALAAADELGIFPYLDKKPSTIKEISQGLNLEPRGVDALLGVLAGLGFVELNKDLYINTKVSLTFLLPDSPYYWGGVLHNTRRTMLPFYRDLLLVLRKNKKRKNRFDLANEWESAKLDPEEAAWRTKFMHSHSFSAAMHLSQQLDMTGINKFLDVAGGSGGFCIALAMKNPEINFTVMDLPPVCEITNRYIKEYGLAGRIQTFPADMFKSSWPVECDAVFFSDIFHDWDNETCLYLARQSMKSLKPGGQLFLHEMLLDETKNTPLAIAAYSMNMLLFTEGKQFTSKEIEYILIEAGFTDILIEPAYGYFSLIRARK
jgi:cyclopropane fatty-acyl-phospholipid synthase-like methyltransferase